ncbi:MAG: hypothetical protein IKD42_00370 [Kiritimatiellae bacterium]|nr:hypothetical protein [Kiritimatiellia bacterium]
MSQEWNIRSRGHVCTLCGRPLVDKAPVTSALKETDSGYERFDCHPECWKTAKLDWQPFSLWDGVYFAPVKEEKKEPVKKEDAGELLRKLVTLDDPAMKNVVYVLAVLLERSKILVERDAKALDDGTVKRVYEDRKNGDTFVILDPRLRLENLSEVQTQVVELLSGTKTLGEVASSPLPGNDEADASASGDENVVGDGEHVVG